MITTRAMLLNARGIETCSNHKQFAIGDSCVYVIYYRFVLVFTKLSLLRSASRLTENWTDSPQTNGIHTLKIKCGVKSSW